MEPKSHSPISAVAVADQFGRTAKRLGLALDDAFAAHGVTTSRARVLMEAVEAGPVRLSVVAAVVGIAQGTASELVESLVRDGLLSRRADPSDRRAVLLEATEQGRDQAQLWGAVYASTAEELFATLRDEDRAALLALLKALEPLL
jgi:DNA-binding MarR family transcriptional regulator